MSVQSRCGEPDGARWRHRVRAAPVLLLLALVPYAWAGDDQEALPGKTTATKAVSSPLVTAVVAPNRGKSTDVLAGLAPAQDALDTGVLEDAASVLIEKPLDETTASTVIVDQTITQTGRQFVHGFEQAWRDRDGLQRVSIAIYERPSARWGSVIRVEENYTLIYQVVLFPGRGDPMLVGAEAAQAAGKKASIIEAEQLLFKDQDLGDGDL